jgi:triacylglycerol lipase
LLAPSHGRDARIPGLEGRTARDHSRPLGSTAKGRNARMAAKHDIYLIPGFFGFANLGRLRYFAHIDRFLRKRCAARGIDVRVHAVKTPPTASLPRRAARVVETMAETLRDRRSAVHLVGHSSGGLDARLAASPGVALPTGADVARYTARVRTVIAISTPHGGTPLAAFFAMRGGQPLLALLSLATTYLLRFGHLPLAALLRFAAQLTGGDGVRLLPMQRTLLDELSEQLLADFSVGRRRAVTRLLREVVRDQSLLLQLMPEAMDVFNAAVLPREGVRHGSVVTRARPPGIRSALRTGVNPGAQAIHAVYQGLYRLAEAKPAAHYPRPSRAQERVLVRAYGKVPGPRANDGIVPTISQVWGDLIAAARADHLDVIGHFHDDSVQPAHVDWLTTGSGFDAAQFEMVWSRVLDYMLA